MTRIIAGFAGSLPLAVPRSGTRPTSDRVREAIFSALDARGGLDGLRVLDLYAGSGTLGLEALSRGAAVVTLVEKHAAAAGVIRKNAATVLGALPKASGGSSAPRADVVTQAVQPYLRALPVVPGAGFDVVFIDPPYELPEAELADDLTTLAPLLDPDAVVLVERSSRTPEPTWPAGLALDRTRSYGETVLWWASPTP
ncbi:16S rRNA (guanine(966)-N(2))-methyltransferase RsmD [Herbiconiux sp. CPCC 203407]|uniref:16S rRNA (Guanine(966)-N(2))-methyltransferase RsmD n=1 Tax=Herbiconiux oxytropis TaxID=2970915 RepID=A0AA42BU76_9MICO|nr:16S rRNA (guanine(966)-N(2))-methyltransferase RsmD [Herbiconiux oxytropis]MCS5722414.1 16S rRNA (guanine(966)-N(2))-methyltransferase RsmD [Herbiconiux oxytropis]MCS5725931.1 16S rRNA (guanine(966)-N(2))-methyltransferase RsmD [Herbiconiux oxytropis]